MKQNIDCYWRKSGSCNIPLNNFENVAFILASNDPSRIEIINKIKKTLELFELEPKLAIELEENNNLSAFCDNICANIRGSRINIVDLTAPLSECFNCNEVYVEPSVNVYWEYGYAAGLKKPIILICDENQADSIPFNILDKQILYYREKTIEEELGRVLKAKLNEPPTSVPSIEKVEREDPLNIGKMTDSLKTKGKGEMISMIRNLDFNQILKLTENVMETLSFIESWEEYEEHEGLSTFIILLLRNNFSDDEYIKIFEIVFRKFLIISDYRMESIHERINNFIRKVPIKNWIIKSDLIKDLIDIFLFSNNFKEAGLNAQIIYIFVDNLVEDQVIKILKRSLGNDQILGSRNANNILNAIIRIYRDIIPLDLRQELIDNNLDEKAISIIEFLFRRINVSITIPAIDFFLGLDHYWEVLEEMVSKIKIKKDFPREITIDVIEKFTAKEKKEEKI